MMSTLFPWIAQGGVVGALAWVGYRLHVDAVRAERGRADDHKEAAKAWQAVASEQRKQLDILLGRDPKP